MIRVLMFSINMHWKYREARTPHYGQKKRYVDFNYRAKGLFPSSSNIGVHRDPKTASIFHNYRLGAQIPHYRAFDATA